jgi:hypothetical protein
MSCKAPIDCEDLFKMIFERFDKLEEMLKGNGKPGITVRLDRVESKVNTVAKLAWVTVGVIITAIVKGLFG